MNEAQRDVALFRYSLIREAADDVAHHPPARRARARAGRAGPRRPDGRARPRGARDDRPLDPGLSGRRLRGVGPESRTGEPVTEKRLLDLAEALKREVPRRTAAQVAQIIRTTEGGGAVGAHAPAALRPPRAQHPPRRVGPRRPSAASRRPRPDDLWTGDALHGPVIAGRKTYLFAFIDDHSRALVGYRWGLSEDTVRLEAALRNALAARGVPAPVYLDNGSAIVSKQLLRACASLGIRLVHSRPGRPQGRGKIERVFETVRIQFLVEIEARPPGRRGRAQPALQRLGRDRLSPPRPLRDRPGPDRAAARPAARRRCRPRRRSTRRSCGPRPAR